MPKTIREIAHIKLPAELAMWEVRHPYREPNSPVAAGLEMVPRAIFSPLQYRRAVHAGLVTNGNAFKGYKLTEKGAALLINLGLKMPHR